MAKAIALWTRPNDEAAFDRDYEENHARIVRELPGIEGFEAHKIVQGDKYRVAILTFGSIDDLQSALASETGARLLEDTARLQQHYETSVDLLIAE